MRLLLFIGLSIGFSQAHCQEILNLPSQNRVQEINQAQYTLAKKSLLGLTGFATVNMVSGLIGRELSTGQTRYFHEMNFGFNTVNFVLGGLGYLSLKKSDQADFADLLKSQMKYEKIYLFNAGLDIGYMLGGIALRQYGFNQTLPEQARYIGYSNSILLQGGFLFVYDLFLYTLHHRNTTRLLQKPIKIELGMSANGLGFIWKV